MRVAYRVLALLVALGVVVQAAAVAFGDSGLFVWIAGGGVLDAAAMEGEATPFPEVTGFIVHGMNGMIVIPALAVILLVVSFFARVPRGVVLAGGLVVAVALQVTLGLLGHSVPVAGLLHGANALLVFGLAVSAAQAARQTTPGAMTTPPREAAPDRQRRADIG